MNEWQPVQTYDALNVKPKLAVFYFEATHEDSRGNNKRAATIQTTRTYGYRICTHWLELPQLPKEISL